jgi:hypothetical protein
VSDPIDPGELDSMPPEELHVGLFLGTADLSGKKWYRRYVSILRPTQTAAISKFIMMFLQLLERLKTTERQHQRLKDQSDAYRLVSMRAMEIFSRLAMIGRLKLSGFTVENDNTVTCRVGDWTFRYDDAHWRLFVSIGGQEQFGSFRVSHAELLPVDVCLKLADRFWRNGVTNVMRDSEIRALFEEEAREPQDATPSADPVTDILGQVVEGLGRLADAPADKLQPFYRFIQRALREM